MPLFAFITDTKMYELLTRKKKGKHMKHNYNGRKNNIIDRFTPRALNFENRHT